VELTVNDLRGDDDQDGVPNNDDNCPNTGPGETVDENGCSADDYFNLEDEGKDIRDIVEQNEPVFREPEMVFVQGGTFQMGCKDDNERGIICEDNEKPVHQVQLDDFSIGKYEVTQEEWEAVMGNNPSGFKDCPKCPIESVSWNDVQEFIQKLNERTGKNYRLPTEAEWEYAARGGQEGGYEYIYSGSNDLDEVGWYENNSGFKTHPVGGKKQNTLGLYDMSGNVWELCSDWYSEDYYENSPGKNPQGPLRGSYRVNRGGSWFVQRRALPGILPQPQGPDRRYRYLGFRLAHSSK
jgi:formylglycine-generating enzyme required for sulfatase activity